MAVAPEYRVFFSSCQEYIGFLGMQLTLPGRRWCRDEFWNQTSLNLLLFTMIFMIWAFYTNYKNCMLSYAWFHEELILINENQELGIWTCLHFWTSPKSEGFCGFSHPIRHSIQSCRISFGDMTWCHVQALAKNSTNICSKEISILTAKPA